MIDWLTLSIDLQLPDGTFRFGEEATARLRSLHGRIMAVAADGEVEWETSRWESMRSDSHRLAVRVTDKLWIQGSPARMLEANNVFGPRCIRDSSLAMIHFCRRHLTEKGLWLALPDDLDQWHCTRVDVTLNHWLGSLSAVREALLTLKQSEGGHYQTSTRSETVYWNERSRLRSGKAYAKGPHLRRQINRAEAEAKPRFVAMCDGLLRLEMKLGAQFWRERAERPWFEWSADELEAEHYRYFSPLVGNLRVVDMSDSVLMERVVKSAKTAGQGRGAWGTYCRIRAEGYRHVQETMNRRTWFHHRKILLSAGIPLSQLQNGQVVSLVRHRSIALGAPVHSFAELEQRARNAA